MAIRRGRTLSGLSSERCSSRHGSTQEAYGVGGIRGRRIENPRTLRVVAAGRSSPCGSPGGRLGCEVHVRVRVWRHQANSYVRGMLVWGSWTGREIRKANQSRGCRRARPVHGASWIQFPSQAPDAHPPGRGAIAGPAAPQQAEEERAGVPRARAEHPAQCRLRRQLPTAATAWGGVANQLTACELLGLRIERVVGPSGSGAGRRAGRSLHRPRHLGLPNEDLSWSWHDPTTRWVGSRHSTAVSCVLCARVGISPPKRRQGLVPLSHAHKRPTRSRTIGTVVSPVMQVMPLVAFTT